MELDVMASLRRDAVATSVDEHFLRVVNVFKVGHPNLLRGEAALRQRARRLRISLYRDDSDDLGNTAREGLVRCSRLAFDSLSVHLSVSRARANMGGRTDKRFGFSQTVKLCGRLAARGSSDFLVKTCDLGNVVSVFSAWRWE